MKNRTREFLDRFEREKADEGSRFPDDDPNMFDDGIWGLCEEIINEYQLLVEDVVWTDPEAVVFDNVPYKKPEMLKWTADERNL